jgi:hypothetical protein
MKSYFNYQKEELQEMGEYSFENLVGYSILKGIRLNSGHSIMMSLKK